MSEIDEGLATLIAAIFAATTSLLTLLSTKGTEIRAANRKTLEPFIPVITTSIHQLIATSNILLKTKTEESRGNWREKAETAKTKLKEIRPKIRYPLWGIEESLQTLSRLPDFTQYCLLEVAVANKVVKRGTRLGNALDECIKDCYLNGRAPRFYECWLINFYDWHFRRTRDKYKSGQKRDA